MKHPGKTIFTHKGMTNRRNYLMQIYNGVPICEEKQAL